MIAYLGAVPESVNVSLIHSATCLLDQQIQSEGFGHFH